MITENISHIEFIESEPQIERPYRIGDIAEENDGILAGTLRELEGTGEFLNPADNHFHFPRDGHPDYRFPEDIAHHLIIHDNDTIGIEVWDPGLKQLSMDKPVIHSD